MEIDKAIKKSCTRMQKKVLKVSKKLFGISKFALLFEDMIEDKTYLEKAIGKEIDKFTDKDIMEYSYLYASYKTKKRLCDIYMEFTKFMVLDLNDMKEGAWTQENLNE